MRAELTIEATKQRLCDTEINVIYNIQLAPLFPPAREIN